MSASFAYSDVEGTKFPDHCRAAVLTWNDIAGTIAMSEEIGKGVTKDDGSVELTFTYFTMTLNPDGTFSGKRLTSHATEPAEKT